MLGQNLLKNQKGMAILEMIPITIIMVLLLSFAFGFFGVIHTGILNSMAARNYAFETFNHRADLTYFRSTVDSLGGDPKTSAYQNMKYRVHAIVSDKRRRTDESAMATAREIAFGWSFGRPDTVGNGEYHNKDVFDIKDDGTRYTTREGVNPVWIQTTYGICLNSRCEK